MNLQIRWDLFKWRKYYPHHYIYSQPVIKTSDELIHVSFVLATFVYRVIS